MIHWNCWYGEQQHQRHGTEFTLLQQRSEWKEPVSQDPFEEKKSALDLLKKRRHEQLEQTRVLQEAEDVDPDLVFTPEELEQIVPNAEDQKFYPGKFSMWRFDTDKSTATPYHRLSVRQQLLVRAKFGPKIVRILWTRWPRAQVDGMKPKEPEPVV
jgi:hypothetical protein